MTEPAVAPSESVVARAFTIASARILVANMVGATMSFVFLAIVSPLPSTISKAKREHVIHVAGAVFAVFMVVMGVVVGLVMYRRLRAASAWAVEDRAPTRDEVARVLALPHTLLRPPGIIWLLAATTFGLLQVFLDTGWVVVLRVSTGILLGGLITSTLTYLLVERALRPAAALVLSYGLLDRPRAPGILPRVIVSWLLGSALPLVSVGLSQLFRTPAERGHLAAPTWFLVVTGTITGAIAMVVAAKSIAEPIRDVRNALGEVQRGRLEVSVPVKDASEVGLLQTGFNDMVAGLRERRRLQDIFGRHVGEEVARQALDRGANLGGETRDVSVLFADVVGSTAMAQQRPAEELVAALNAFFEAVVSAVRDEGGWVNKFAGDGALCVFGAPADLPDHRACALRAARGLRTRLDLLPAALGIDAGIGVSAGQVTAGNVGAEERFEYTVIGDPVNEAARLTEAAKSVPGHVLAGESAVAGAGDEARNWRCAGSDTLRGRDTPTAYYIPVA
jgi:adenylate cyclase